MIRTGENIGSKGLREGETPQVGDPGNTSPRENSDSPPCSYAINKKWSFSVRSNPIFARENKKTCSPRNGLGHAARCLRCEEENRELRYRE